MTARITRSKTLAHISPPIKSETKPSIEKTAAIFAKKEPPKVFDLPALSKIFKQEIKDAEKLPDSIWRSIHSAPYLMEVDLMITFGEIKHEKDLNATQKTAFKLIEVFLQSRKDPTKGLLYSMNALYAKFHRFSIFPSHLRKVTMIAMDHLKKIEKSVLDNLVKEHSTIFLMGLATSQKVHSMKKEEIKFKKFILNNFDKSLVYDINRMAKFRSGFLSST